MATFGANSPLQFGRPATLIIYPTSIHHCRLLSSLPTPRKSNLSSFRTTHDHPCERLYQLGTFCLLLDVMHERVSLRYYIQVERFDHLRGTCCTDAIWSQSGRRLDEEVRVASDVTIDKPSVRPRGRARLVVQHESFVQIVVRLLNPNKHRVSGQRRQLGGPRLQPLLDVCDLVDHAARPSRAALDEPRTHTAALRSPGLSPRGQSGDLDPDSATEFLATDGDFF